MKKVFKVTMLYLMYLGMIVTSLLLAVLELSVYTTIGEVNRFRIPYLMGLLIFLIICYLIFLAVINLCNNKVRDSWALKLVNCFTFLITQFMFVTGLYGFIEYISESQHALWLPKKNGGLEYVQLINDSGLQLYAQLDRLLVLIAFILLEAVCIIVFISIIGKSKTLNKLLLISIIGLIALPIINLVENAYYSSIESGVIVDKQRDGYQVKLISSKTMITGDQLEEGWYNIIPSSRTEVEVLKPSQGESYTYTAGKELNCGLLSCEPDEDGLTFYYDSNTAIVLSKDSRTNAVFEINKKSA